MKYDYSYRRVMSLCSIFFFAALQDACLLGALEDGLNALLSIEVRMIQHLLGFMLAASPMIFPVIFIVFSSLNCATIIVLHDNVR